MVVIGALFFQDLNSVLQKSDRGIYRVTADDRSAFGFAIGGGKYLVTCDHVIGHDSKIVINDPTGKPRNGFLVFHNPKMDLAVYRMDRVSPVSLNVNSDTVKAGSTAFLISSKPRERTWTVGAVAGVKREGEFAYVEMKGDFVKEDSGSPFLNSKGEVIGRYLASATAENPLAVGISGYNISQYLKDQVAPPAPPMVIGNIGQVLDTTRVSETADLDSRTLFTANPSQLLLVNDYSADFLNVMLPNGVTGYIRSAMVKIVTPNVSIGSQGIVNGFEVVRVVKTFDPSNLHESSDTAAWQKETVRFVSSVFSTAGREISTDISVQMDIGRSVDSSSELQAGDRIYFGTSKSLWAAIYLGNGEYISVNKAGKLITTRFGESATKPFYRALH